MHLHDQTDECMIWPYSTNTHGYPQINFAGQVTQVHILTCVAHHGPRPDGAEVAHGPCHDRRCWNGRHLSWKTHTENMADTLRDGTRLQGEGVRGSKLTKEAVLLIRERAAGGALTHRELAEQFGISRTVITRVINRNIWRHV